MDKPIRFAALVRVSTERQEKKGESLRTQSKQIESAVHSLGGKVVQSYCGQEHATEGYERELLDKLLSDARKAPRPFDAVIVVDPSRWSRDNIRSETGLETLRDAKVRFFVLGSEYDLYDPQARLFLALASSIGAFQAKMQAKKSLLNKIERAKRGLPVCGALPFGRAYDPDKQEWSIIPEKKAMVEDIARRFLAGEPMTSICDEYGEISSVMIYWMKFRCGDTWIQTFVSDDLGINESVPTPVPRLLDEETIQSVITKLREGRTCRHRPPKNRSVHDYLLGGYIFCGNCGRTMTGQAHKKKHLYYCHRRTRDVCCTIRPRPTVKARMIETQVLSDLFGMFGNPAELERAIRNAIPDSGGATEQKTRLENEIGKVEKARKRIMDLVIADALTTDQAKGELAELKEREANLRESLERILAQLVNTPDENTIRVYVDRIGESIIAYDDDGYPALGGNDLTTLLNMSWDDKRSLVERVFSQPQRDGSPAGVYIYPEGDNRGNDRRKRWKYSIKGMASFEFVMTRATSKQP